MSKFMYSMAALGLSAAVLCGCESESKDSHAKHDHSHGGGQPTTLPARGDAAIARNVAVAKIGPSKVASTQPAVRMVAGTATFTQENGAVRVVVDVTGLPPNSRHGFHIHEKGDLSAPDLASAGAHYDPEKHAKHGGPGDTHVHAGDLGNLETDGNGVAHLEIALPHLTVDGPNNAILGKSIIIHAKADDLKTQPTGDSGGRIAGGLIQRLP